ncbi:hypothetical protein Taro_006315 [Colocasia esculenta]|uniref:Legume lectin domain-containing protein n=1 Tax=Colocasia esculenta TaxID=4460 RepID=A0A843TND1_COLES|nr:hypothetical protein [Colocasia esculenta]
MVPRINLVWLLLLLLTTNCEEEGVSFNGFRGAGALFRRAFKNSKSKKLATSTKAARIGDLGIVRGENLFRCGFKHCPSLNGSAIITSEGLLRLTNPISHQIDRAFYPRSLHFRSSKTGNVFFFSTTFVFVFVPENIGIGGHGIAFVISPTKDFHGATGTQFLGLFNKSINCN